MAPMPKRWLKLTSPYMSGEDVRVLQVALGNRAEARGLGKLKADGEYGPATQEMLHRVLYYLGAPAEKLDIGATTELQKLVREPDRRSKVWLSVADDRAAFQEKLQKAKMSSAKGVIAWAQGYVGKHEQPIDSNRGPWLDPLLRAAGWDPPRGVYGPPYCGIFVINGLRRAGLVVPNSWSYAPNILNDAHAGRHGFKLVSKESRAPGDVLLFKFPGVSRDSVDHTGFCKTKPKNIEANTSAGPGGSQNNGGGVYERSWADRGQFCVGVVRPPWRSAR